MTENAGRRDARRQQRGLQRQAEILQAAGWVFAEVGYADSTTNAIAARAGISPGSLYQFFSNKEAIANALGLQYAHELHMYWDQRYSADMAALPIPELVNVLIDSLIEFNTERPGFAVLFFGDDALPQLTAMGNMLHEGMIARFAALIGARAPQLDLDKRELIANVMMRIYKAFIPLLIATSPTNREDMLHEMKLVMRGYLGAYLSG